MAEKYKLDTLTSYVNTEYLTIDDITPMVKAEAVIPTDIDARTILYALSVPAIKQLRVKSGPGRGVHLYARKSVEEAIAYMKEWYANKQ